MQDQAHYIGHRRRQKQKFLANNGEGFAEYELLELLLFFSVPRKDVKPLAKSLLERFGTIADLINADKDKLLLLEGVTENVCVSFFVIRQVINRVLKQKVVNQNIISSWGALMDYLRSSMGNLKLEQFRVIFLNKKNVLIADDIIATGTVDQAMIYPREILKRILFYEASAIVLAHNHPSGKAQPSKADIDLTNKIIEVCNTVNVAVHDHIIISNTEYFSFKSHMLI